MQNGLIIIILIIGLHFERRSNYEGLLLYNREILRFYQHIELRLGKIGNTVAIDVQSSSTKFTG